MKNIIKKSYYFYLALPLLFIFSFLTTIFNPTNSAFADKVILNPTLYWRAYTINNNLVSEAWNNTSPSPKIILYWIRGEYRTVQGFSVDFGVEDTLTTRYKTLVVQFTLTQTDVEGIPHSGRKSLANPTSHLNAGTSAQTIQGPQCTTQWLSDYALQFTCTVKTQDYQTITNAQATVGYAPTTTIHPDPVAVLCGTDIDPSCAGNVTFSGFSYELTGTNSPTDTNVERIYTELTEVNQNLEALQLQNETIISQNQEIIDYIKDDTPPSVDASGLSNAAGWLPAGPVDSILTLPIQLLQGIVNAFTNTGTCTPISLPIPIAREPLVIPCMRPYLEQAGYTAIFEGVGSVIGAFIIYETLKWLYDYVDKTLTMRENNSGLWGGL